MAFHSHGQKPFEAQRFFTDREEPLALFDKAFAASQERDDHCVICWHGVGGQGKSSLHDEIRRRVAGIADVALAGLDFDVPRHRRLEDAMLKLRGDLSGRGLSFPTFDLAFARHVALERPGENIREIYPQLFRPGESEIVDDMVDWSEEAVKDALKAAVEGLSLAIPGLNLLYKYGARLTGRLADWWKSQAVKDKLAGLDQLSPSDIAGRLPHYLGFDIWRARAEIGCPRIVITIDTHEKLTGGELRGDLWLQTLVQETPGALFLIFGRDRLRWAELDARWTDVLDQHLLVALSDADADSFLARAPIPETDIRARIVSASKGLPHYLDLSVSLYEDIRNDGRTPMLDDFGTTPAGVRERFLEHLTEDERRELFLATYPESLTENLFLDLADAFMGGAGNVRWARIGRRSFMTTTDDNRLIMHALMRDALQDQDAAERPEFFGRVHEHLFESYAERARDVDARSVTAQGERALIAAAFHAGRLGRSRLLRYIQSEIRTYDAAARWRTLDGLLENALRLFPEASVDRAWILHELANVRQAIGRNAEAEALSVQALAIYQAALGEAHPDFAITLHNLAHVLQAMGRYAEAETLYVQALAIKKAALGEAHPDFATTLHELAGVRQAMGRNAEAETLFVQALAIYQAALGEAHPHCAATLHALASVRQAMGRNAEAETLYVQVLAITKAALGEAHPHAVFCLASLAGCRAMLGKLDAARSDIALAVSRAAALTEGADLWTGRVRLRWAQGLAGSGLPEEARLEAAAAASLLEKALGPDAAYTQEARKLLDDLGGA
ncbi:MAG: tetratricopeptide repeat protein [Rhodobacter sp.]|nr:tetratricopeptide repeat protein [Rhodobacter sp.]